jgi:hypothetical protein
MDNRPFEKVVVDQQQPLSSNVSRHDMPLLTFFGGNSVGLALKCVLHRVSEPRTNLGCKFFIPAKTSPWSSRSKWLSVFCDVIKRVGVMRCSRGNAVIRSASTCAAALRLASLAHKAQNFLMVLPQRSAVAYRNKRDVQLLAVLVQKPLAILGDTYY